MNKTVRIFVLTAVLLSLCSCTVIRELPEPPKQALTEKQKAEQKEDYEAGRTLLEAFLKNDARRFVDQLPPKLRTQFGHKQFEEARKAVMESMGEPVSFRYVTRLEMTSITPHVWAVRFVRTRGKEKFYSEILFRVVTGRVDGKTYIFGFHFL